MKTGSDGEKYEWDWKDGKLYWKGVITRSDGTKYEWDFKNGRRHWKGKSTYDQWKKQIGWYYEGGEELFGWFSREKDSEKDHSILRGEMNLNENWNAKEVTSRGNTIRLQEKNQWYLFETQSKAKLTLPKSLERKWALNAANLINSAVSAVKNSWFKLDKFEAQFWTLQADYKGEFLDTDIIRDVQGKFWVSAKALAEWMNEYRKDVGI